MGEKEMNFSVYHSDGEKERAGPQEDHMSKEVSMSLLWETVGKIPTTQIEGVS